MTRIRVNGRLVTITEEERRDFKTLYESENFGNYVWWYAETFNVSVRQMARILGKVNP